MNVRECIVESRKSLFAVIEIRKRDYRPERNQSCSVVTSLYVSPLESDVDTRTDATERVVSTSGVTNPGPVANG